MAYNYHDIDDGLRANLLTLEELQEVGIIKQQLNLVLSNYPDLKGRRLHKELVRSLINVTIYDLIETTLENIKQHGIKTLEDVKNAPTLVSYSEEMYNSQRELKKFLHKNLYKHSSVMQLRFKAANIIRALFNAFMSEELLLPNQFRVRVPEDGLHRVVADYISGMTDS